MVPAPLQLPPRSPSSRAAVLRAWLIGTFAGRALLLGAFLKLAAMALNVGAAPPGRGSTLDTVGDLALVLGAAILLYRLFVDIKRLMLWRVRRKMTLSYIFIGFVPALLIITFFLLCGTLLVYNVSSLVMHGRVVELVAETDLLARMAAVGLEAARTPAEVRAVLAGQQAAASVRHPGVSYSLVPARRMCGSATPLDGPVQAIHAGPWTHARPPDDAPGWIPCTGLAGLTVYAEEARRDGERVPARLAPRAVARPQAAFASYAVIVDVPMTREVTDRLRADTGILLMELGILANAGGTLVESDPPPMPPEPGAAPAPQAPASTRMLDLPFEYLVFFDTADWETGERRPLTVAITSSLAEMYRRMTPAEGGGTSVGLGLLLLVIVVGVLLLIIQIIAFVMGLALARSITGSVHELFEGTERVQRGDFTHKITIRSRDQLGQLAESFNSMTASIENLLEQKAEKERLEQELRIARSIQMSLLPQGHFPTAGYMLTAHCEPARQVGGDYYDYLRIDSDRLGILIADVSGKGTSAALYMAELKGIVLSLSRMHDSPRALLIDANRILSGHLDSRSFITVTYAVLDVRQRTLRYARAGHCPLIYMPGPGAASREPQILMPDGMVVGLQIDDHELFPRLLEESTITVGAGDLFCLYTDGISETMNPQGDLFGDQRLASLIGGHADMPSEQLRERILRDVRAFAGTAVQQDDMTMVLLKMDDAAAAPRWQPA